jgi:hypothetical protein
MNFAQCGLLRKEGKMDLYKGLGCGGNVPLENCAYYQYKLKQTPNDKSLQNLMDNDKCKDVLNQNLNQTLGGVYETYSALDKQRIEAESKYQRNKKLFIGGMVFLTVVGILLIRKK